MPQKRGNRIFFGKSGSVTFEHLLSPNFMQNIRNVRTDGHEFIGPCRQGGGPIMDPLTFLSKNVNLLTYKLKLKKKEKKKRFSKKVKKFLRLQGGKITKKIFFIFLFRMIHFRKKKKKKNSKIFLPGNHNCPAPFSPF